MTITVLAAVGANLVIGRDGDMPWHLPEDLAHFKATTMGHTMVMGRKTYDAIGRALPGRRTIVITRQEGWHAPGVEVAHSLADALALAGPTEVFVIGGGQVYREAMPFADQMMLTEIEQSPEGDAFFPRSTPITGTRPLVRAMTVSRSSPTSVISPAERPRQT